MIVTVENMSTLVLPKGTARALRDLTGEPRPDVALLLVLRDALAYRLGQIETDLRAFEAKYGMPFDEYRQRWESQDRDEDYHWEAKRDYLEWEALITQRARLEDVYSWLT
ncbi:MAG TPA: hypothetical protein VMY40_09240 [Anaerolineae bacterium]|nr:hypothetical protein [Anaerolineae bacterium]